MDNRRFELGYSHLALIFQLFLLLIISVLLFLTLQTVLVMIGILLCTLSLIWWRKYSQVVHYFEYLGEGVWSIQFKNYTQIHQVSVKKIIDHHLYILVYFEEKQINTLVIWCDQLTFLQLKMLKILVKAQ